MYVKSWCAQFDVYFWCIFYTFCFSFFNKVKEHCIMIRSIKNSRQRTLDIRKRKIVLAFLSVELQTGVRQVTTHPQESNALSTRPPCVLWHGSNHGPFVTIFLWWMKERQVFVSCTNNRVSFGLRRMKEQRWFTDTVFTLLIFQYLPVFLEPLGSWCHQENFEMKASRW